MEARPLGEQPGNIFSHFSVAPGQEEATDPVLVPFTGNSISSGNDLGTSSFETTSCSQTSVVFRGMGELVRGVLTAQSVWHTY